jgi:tetratricopeptide (TPR) repeat protein
LEARGASAQSLAADLVSRLAAIRATANRNSFNHSEEVRASEARTLKVEIPQTGISLDELERFVHRWLGHQSVMNGQVREQADGLISLSLHIAGFGGVEVTGPKVELDRLSQEAAEKAFATFDPNNFAIYLASSGRRPEALRAMEHYVQSAELMSKPARDRADAYSLLGGMDPQPRRALSRALIAIDLDPQVGVGWTEAARASAELGHDQNAADYYRKVLGTKAEDQAPEQRAGYSNVIREARLAIETATGDYAAVNADNAASPFARRTNDEYAASARTAAALHDEPRSRQQLALALAAGPVDSAVLTAQWSVSAATGEWRGALSDAKALIADAEAKKAAAPDADWAGEYELVLQTAYRPWLALAQFMNGDGAAAAALAAQSPVDCYLCARVRARIAAADDVSSDHGFEAAIRQAPNLPMAYWEWGQALLRRGDLSGAAKQFALAHEKGPRFADPLKDWGDVLQKQGRSREALTKYDEALKYAPNWAALKGSRTMAAKAL